MTTDQAYGIICKDEKYIDFYKCDVDFHIDDYLFHKGRKTLSKIMKKKSNDVLFQRSLVLSHSYSNIKLIMSEDLFLGYNGKTNNYGDLLLKMRKQFHQTNPENYNKFLMLASITQNKEHLDELQSYFAHIYHTLCYLFKDLGWEKNIKSVKNALKIVYPHFYVLYKHKENIETRCDVLFMKDCNEDINQFIYKFLKCIYLNMEENISKKPKKPSSGKSMEEIVKLLSLLFFYTPKNIPNKVDKICFLFSEKLFNRDVKTRKKKIPQEWELKFKEYKIKDVSVQHDILEMSSRLFNSFSFRQF
jgi:hypothetical protein